MSASGRGCAKSPALPVPRFFPEFKIKDLHIVFFYGKGFSHNLGQERLDAQHRRAAAIQLMATSAG
jgi:hypothetical protein